VAFGRHARRDDLEREGDGLVLLDDRMGVAVGEGKDHVPIGVADGAGQGSVGSGLGVVVQRGGAGRQEEAGDRRGHRRGVVWVLGMLLRLVGAHHGLLSHLGFHAVDWGGHGRVVRAELLVRDRRTRVHGVRVRWWRQLFMLQRHGRLDAEELRTRIFKSAVRRNCKCIEIVLQLLQWILG